MDTHFFLDLHCHTSIKAFAKSFKNKAGEQSEYPDHPSSIWCQDKPSLFDKIKNYIVTLTNFVQSDATSLLNGSVGIVFLSFYPQEKNFFSNKLGTGLPSDLVTKLVTEFGQQRIDHIQNLQSYWDDLKLEMNFLKQGEHKFVKVHGKLVSYSIAQSYNEIELVIRSETLGINHIVFVPTIEGCHVFDQIMDANEKWDSYPEGIPEDKLKVTLQRVKELRLGQDGLLRPLFVTFAHHFWNGLCGHERSLGNLVRCAIDQENGLKQGITPAGKTVIRALLKNEFDGNGKNAPPIYIDVKHMSRLSREQYYLMLDTEFSEMEIPVIASHAGVTGLNKPGGITVSQAAKEGLYMPDPINFFDDELLRIEKSRGLFGIQLDERRIGSKTALNRARGNIRKRDILYAWAKLVWNQVRHIAEVLDSEQRFSWGIQTLGTDFDGIIDPINGYWTSASFDDLDDYLLKHAYNYLKEVNQKCPLANDFNRNINPEEVVDRIMTTNGVDFLAKFYKE